MMAAEFVWHSCDDDQLKLAVCHDDKCSDDSVDSLIDDDGDVDDDVDDEGYDFDAPVA